MIFRRVYHYFVNYSFTDFLRKTFDYFFSLVEFLLRIPASIRSVVYFKRPDVLIGKRVEIKGICFDIKVGDTFEVYSGAVLEFGHCSKVEIGNNCLFSYGVIFQCFSEISIGNDVQIGEYTSLRDTTHSYSSSEIPIKYQSNLSLGIKIEDDVWIGRGCIILPGTVIERGVIIGANSLVKGKLEAYGVYGGSPARLIKKRN